MEVVERIVVLRRPVDRQYLLLVNELERGGTRTIFGERQPVGRHTVDVGPEPLVARRRHTKADHEDCDHTERDPSASPFGHPCPRDTWGDQQDGEREIRTGRAEVLDRDEAHEQRADDVAHDVREQQRAGVATERVHALRHERLRARERGAHAQHRRTHDQEGNPEEHRQERAVRGAVRIAEAEVESVTREEAGHALGHGRVWRDADQHDQPDERGDAHEELEREEPSIWSRVVRFTITAPIAAPAPKNSRYADSTCGKLYEFERMTESMTRKNTSSKPSATAPVSP